MSRNVAFSAQPCCSIFSNKLVYEYLAYIGFKKIFQLLETLYRVETFLGTNRVWRYLVGVAFLIWLFFWPS